MGRARRGRFGAALVCLVVLGASRPAHAGDPAAARELLKRGYLLAQDGHCDQAVSLYDESVRLDPKAITLINYADCEEKLARLGSALGHWVDARARAKVEGNVAVEAEAERRAKLLEPRLARLTVLAPPNAPEGTTVERDGVALGAVSYGIATPVDPGSHTLVVKAPGRDDETVTVALAEGETRQVQLALGRPGRSSAAAPKRAEARSGTSPLVWVGFGVGAAGLAVGSVTGLMAIGRANDAERACPGGNCPDRASLDAVEDGRTLGTVSTIAFVAGGAGIAFGAAMLLFAPSPAKKEAASVRVHVAPSGVVLRGTF